MRSADRLRISRPTPTPFPSLSQNIQIDLRTSIRRLRLAKASPAPLLDPAFAGSGNGALGVGGVALGDKLKPLAPAPASRTPVTLPAGLSTAALALEAESWRDLAGALRGGEGQAAKSDPPALAETRLASESDDEMEEV